MNTRNARYNSRGSIDVEIEHPKFGWIPFTADPNDPEPHGRQLFDQLKDIAEPFQAAS